MDQQPYTARQRGVSARTPPSPGEAASAPGTQTSPRRSKKLIRAVKLLDVLTTGDQALLDYLAENRAACVRAVELAREDMAEAETPEEAALLQPDPVDELIALPPPSQPADIQALRDALLLQCQETIAAELATLSREPNRLISLCGVTGCEVHEIDPRGNILRHISFQESRADPTLSQCRQLLQDARIAYVEVYGSSLVPVSE